MVRNARKWLSAVLAVVMMISMISILAVAEEPAPEPPATNVLYTEDFKVNGGALNKEGVNLIGGLILTQTEFALTIDKHADNSVYVYASEDGVKGTKLGTVGRETEHGAITVQIPNHLNDFIVTLESKDGTVANDYALRLEKGRVVVEADQLMTTENEDGSMYYAVPYDVTSIRFKLIKQDEAETWIVTKEGGEVLTAAANGYYTVDLLAGEEVKIHLEFVPSKEEEVPDFYDFTLARKVNTENELKTLEAAGCVVEKSDDTAYTVTVPKNLTQVDLKMTFSVETVVTVINMYTGEEIAANGDLYSVNYTENDDVIYQVTVEAQNGDIATYDVALTRVKSTECALIGINQVTAVTGGYEAKTEAKTFYVNAIVSPYATYELYADAACTQAIADAFIQLKAAKTELYLVVVAEDGATKSQPVKLTIQTTATDFKHEEKEEVIYQEYTNFGKVAVTGGTSLIENTDEEAKYAGIIYVKGSAIGKKMHFAMEALNEYEPKGVRLYADMNKTILLNNALDLVPDSIKTNLYAVLEVNGVKEEYQVIITSDISYTFKDLKEDDWAKKYAEALGTAGLMNGFPGGEFKGNNPLTRNEMAALMVRLAGANKELYAEVAYKFQDPSADWAVNYVKAATRIGLIDGSPVTNADGEVEGYTYDGDRNATRAEFVKVLGNALLIGTEYEDVTELYNEQKSTIDAKVEELKFKDIEKVPDWAKPYIYVAVDAGWINGSSEVDGVYLNAENEINRFEVAAIVARAIELVA